MPRFEQDQITYELFGIDPREFYSKRYDLGRASPDLLCNPLDWFDAARAKVRLLVEELRTRFPGGCEVLDVGCGSGQFGPTLLKHVPGIRLLGVDLSEACVERARANGYAQARAVDFLGGLPYADARFDAVISTDLFGHVEFKHKDGFIAELARITRPGGAGVHGAESAWVDYFDSDPSDPEDPIRRYVWQEGHVGVEPPARTSARFGRHFSRVAKAITFLYPFLPGRPGVELLLGKDAVHLSEFLSNPHNEYAANVLIGAANAYFIRLFGQAFGDSFEPYVPTPEAHAPTLGPPSALDAVFPGARKLFQPAGFTTFVLTR